MPDPESHEQRAADAGSQEPATCPRILVVDDCQDNLDLIVEWFENEPWNVQAVDNVQDAWALMKKWRPDLVLLDVEMPGFTGHHLCTAMGMKPALNDVPVIFLTAAHRDPEDVARGLKMGACDYICRPIDGHELRRRVREALDHHARQPIGAQRGWNAAR